MQRHVLHFRTQAGPGSCFKNYKEDVKMYDTISTITDKKKMKQFSAHLPSHKLVRRSCISVATPPTPLIARPADLYYKR